MNALKNTNEAMLVANNAIAEMSLISQESQITNEVVHAAPTVVIPPKKSSVAITPIAEPSTAPISVVTDLPSVSPTAVTPNLSSQPPPLTTATPSLIQCASQDSLLSASTEDSPKQRRVIAESIIEDPALVENAEVMEMLTKEKEKIEKESRAARRAFEQRIQKHKIIQVMLSTDVKYICNYD